MNQVYNHAIANPEDLNQYEPFSPEVLYSNCKVHFILCKVDIVCNAMDTSLLIIMLCIIPLVYYDFVMSWSLDVWPNMMTAMV